MLSSAFDRGWNEGYDAGYTRALKERDNTRAAWQDGYNRGFLDGGRRSNRQEEAEELKNLKEGEDGDW